jgi:hypothetical protein
MKALTIQEPWLSCILYYGKDVENRSYRFPKELIDKQIALHTSKKIDRYELTAVKSKYGIVVDPLPGGQIVAIARITKSFINSDSPWAVERNIHWSIVVDRILKTPIPARGQLGLWTVPPEAEAMISAELKTKPQKEIRQLSIF